MASQAPASGHLVSDGLARQQNLIKRKQSYKEMTLGVQCSKKISEFYWYVYVYFIGLLYT